MRGLLRSIILPGTWLAPCKHYRIVHLYYTFFLCLQLQELLITTTLKHEMPDLEQEHGILIKQKVRWPCVRCHGLNYKQLQPPSQPLG